MDNMPLVSVALVTYNSEAYLGKCLDALLGQSGILLHVIVVDNDSHDGTRRVLSRYSGRCETLFNARNLGFCAAQNQAIRQTRGEWVLALNPDVLLEPAFLATLTAAGSLDARVGVLCGKLLQANSDLSIASGRRIDSAGIYFTPAFRHFDRGQGRPDGPAYSQPAYVFGATGAAALYRRSMIEETSVNGELFDEDFFFYREDADLAWRAQLMGWKCLYVPGAVGHHVRRVSPAVRRTLPSEINRHSVQNRFLMRIKNATASLYLRNIVSATARDAGILAYCVLRERSSLAAFPFVLRNWRRTWAKRRIIQARRQVSEAYMRQWFRFAPVALPALNLFGGTVHSTVPSAAKASPSILPAPAESETGRVR